MKYEIEITRRCNFSCPGCDRLCDIASFSPEDTDFNLDDTAHVIQEIKGLSQPVQAITVIGGEPTLNPSCYEICKALKAQLSFICAKFYFATNHSNNDLASKIGRELSYNVRQDDLTTDAAAAAKNKVEKHYASRISPKSYGLDFRYEPSSCWILNDCGISVHKVYGELKWLWCGAGTSLCRMLKKTQFMKSSLKELLESDKSQFFSEICPHCMYLAKSPLYAKDFKNKASAIFKDGLKSIDSGKASHYDFI